MSGYSKYRKLDDASFVYLELTAKGLGKIEMDKGIGCDIQCALRELEDLRADVAELPAGTSIADLVEAVNEAEMDLASAEDRITDLEHEVAELRAQLQKAA